MILNYYITLDELHVFPQNGPLLHAAIDCDGLDDFADTYVGGYVRPASVQMEFSGIPAQFGTDMDAFTRSLTEKLRELSEGIAEKVH